jgi:hypothetical protein
MRKILVSVLTLVGIIAGSQAQPAVQAAEPGIVDRYKNQPIKRLVDAYVLDVVGALPPAAEATLERMNLQRVFKTKASEWHQVLRETLGLSGTFDTAILDLWLRWGDAARAEGKPYPPEQFAAQFTDNYFVDGSQIDVWPPGALEAAKKRIAAARLNR